jgi:hypothetical protein
LFLPDAIAFPKPNGGYPVCVFPMLASWQQTYLPVQIGPTEAAADNPVAIARYFLMHGWAVWIVPLTPLYRTTAGLGSTPNPHNDTFDIGAISPTSRHYGDAPDGCGVVVPFDNGSQPLYYDGSGLVPYQDPSRHTCLRDLAMATQFLQANASAMGVNRKRIALYGASAAAWTAGYVYWMGNLQPQMMPWALPGTQETLPTDAYRAMALSAWQTWIPLMADTQTPWLYPLPRIPQTPSAPEIHYDVAAANRLEASYANMVELSALWFALDPKPLLMTYGQGPAPGAPFDMTQTGTTYNIHAGWFGEAMKQRFPDALLINTSSDPAKWLPSQDLVLASGIDTVAAAILDYFNEVMPPVAAMKPFKRL